MSHKHLSVIILNILAVTCFSFEYMSGNEFQNLQEPSHWMNDYQIVYLPVVLPKREAISEDGMEVEETLLEFTAFGQPISMKLIENSKLVSSNFQTYIQDGPNSHLLPEVDTKCLYLHRNPRMVASISTCNPQTVNGFVFLDNATLQISPLLEDYNEHIKVREPWLALNNENHTPHIIKRVSNENFVLNDGAVRKNHLNTVLESPLRRARDVFRNNEGSNEPRNDEIYTLEVALFFDEAAYKIFAPFMSYTDEKLRDMLLAYLNGVQALYHHPSLGTRLELVLVRMDIMKSQPAKLPTYEGERSQLLDSFCLYQNSINLGDDDNPDHWDMGLYISGLDFFAYENGRKDGATMGLATVGGACYGKFSCVIAEFGSTNIFGKPYPSAGFTSVYILAHEIGHNLGMHHDSIKNDCPKEGYIMSPSRGTEGETKWSTCSAEVMLKLGSKNCLKDHGIKNSRYDHSRFLGAPGQKYTAKKQCEILLTDKDAYTAPYQDSICQNLRCKTPHRSGYYFAGPALDGTECDEGMQCYGGDCIKPVQHPIKVKPGGWGPWQDGKCKSGCIIKSRGYQMRHRECNNPTPVDTDQGCEGSAYESILCKDSKICPSRKTVVDYASEKCKQFSKLIPELDSKGAGLQSPHERERIWMGCTIFCRRREGTYYTPRIELNDLGESPYFPDGTWCHKEDGQDYYCLKHHCLPENFKFTRSWPPIGHEGYDFLQNALPNGNVPKELIPYFSLGSNGKPLDVDVDISQSKPQDEEWELNDYILMPENKINEI